MSKTEFEIGDKFQGSVLFGPDEWLTCDAINEDESGAIYFAGLSESGVRGGNYAGRFPLFWKQGEAFPRFATTGQAFHEYHEDQPQ